MTLEESLKIAANTYLHHNAIAVTATHYQEKSLASLTSYGASVTFMKLAKLRTRDEAIAKIRQRYTH